MARPTKCTPQVIKAFAEHMSSGLMITEASALVGIIDDTAQNWLKWGKEALLEAGNDLEKVEGENEKLWARFFAMVTRAEAKALARNLARMQIAAQDRPKRLVDEETGEELTPGDWRAAEAFLKMRKPKTWGKQEQRHEHTGAGGGPVEVETSGKQRLVLEGDTALAVIAFHEELEEDGEADSTEHPVD